METIDEESQAKLEEEIKNALDTLGKSILTQPSILPDVEFYLHQIKQKFISYCDGVRLLTADKPKDNVSLDT